MSDTYQPQREPASAYSITVTPEWQHIRRYLAHLAEHDREALQRVRDTPNERWVAGAWRKGECGCLIGNAADFSLRLRLLLADPYDGLNALERTSSEAYDRLCGGEDAYAPVVDAIRTEAARLLEGA